MRATNGASCWEPALFVFFSGKALSRTTRQAAYMNDMDLFSHYGRLLGIGEEWKVADVKLDVGT